VRSVLLIHIPVSRNFYTAPFEERFSLIMFHGADFCNYIAIHDSNSMMCLNMNHQPTINTPTGSTATMNSIILAMNVTGASFTPSHRPTTNVLVALSMSVTLNTLPTQSVDRFRQILQQVLGNQMRLYLPRSWLSIYKMEDQKLVVLIYN
jgi:hypothetical protein